MSDAEPEISKGVFQVLAYKIVHLARGRLTVAVRSLHTALPAVIVHLKPTGGAPILKVLRFKVCATEVGTQVAPGWFSRFYEAADYVLLSAGPR